jgi:hypothetical protein
MFGLLTIGSYMKYLRLKKPGSMQSSGFTPPIVAIRNMDIFLKNI